MNKILKKVFTNKLTKTLTPLLLQQQWIEKWDGKLPVYGQVPMLFKPTN